jgi:hypothetical protein
MPDKYRDEPRSSRRRPGREGAFGGAEGRSFGEEGHFSSDQARYYGADRRDYGPYPNHDRAAGEREPWRRKRYGAGRSEDRGVYGSGYDPRGGYGRDEDHSYRSFEGDYHREQEYGIGAGGGRVSGRNPNRGDDLGYGSRGRRGPYADVPYGDQPFPHDAGVREFGPPADYAYHPDLDHDLDLDYLAWRDEQLRGHDRDYAEWRAEQHKRYDADYRSFRSERKSAFGKSFSEWQAQRQAGGQPASSPDGETPDDKV